MRFREQASGREELVKRKFRRPSFWRGRGMGWRRHGVSIIA